MKICPNCDYELKDSAKECPNCFYSISGMKSNDAETAESVNVETEPAKKWRHHFFSAFLMIVSFVPAIILFIMDNIPVAITVLASGLIIAILAFCIEDLYGIVNHLNKEVNTLKDDIEILKDELHKD